MIEIRPSALYSRADLIEMLQPLGIDADAWIARLHPVKRFRQAWFGEDLLDAIRMAPKLREGESLVVNETPILPLGSNRNNRKQRGRISSFRPGTKLDAYLAELKSSGRP